MITSKTVNETANDKTQDMLANKPMWLCTFVNNYQQLSTDNLHLLTEIYHQDITFIDPIHTVEGITGLQAYFARLYTNIQACDFVINDIIAAPNQAAVYWEMHYQHPKLNKGKIVSVTGSSHLKAQDNKVIYHQDYLDVGTMLYEQLPVVGRFIRWIKARAAS